MMTAQIVMRARQIERALHDPGPWTIRVGDVDHPARKVVGDDHVTFYSVLEIPRMVPSYLRCADIQEIELCSGGETVAVKLMEPLPLSQLSWEFLVIAPEQVAA